MAPDNDVSLSNQKATQEEDLPVVHVELPPTNPDEVFPSPEQVFLFDANDPIVRGVAEPFDFEKHDPIRLAMALVTAAHKYGGYGAAAPQIGEPYRVFAVRPGVFSQAIEEFINPKIVKHGRDIVIAEEGCLSLPDVVINVPRFKIVTVEWTTHQGHTKRQAFRNLHARIVQHEIDHLDGILIDDERVQAKLDLTGTRVVD